MSKFKVKLPTWRVYPRVHFFQKRYAGLKDRFRNLIHRFPDNFHNAEKLKEFDRSFAIWSSNLEVNIIGRSSLQLSRFVVDEKPMKDERFFTTEVAMETSQTLSGGVEIYVCYIAAELNDALCRKYIHQALAYLKSFCRSSLNSVFFQMDISVELTSSEKDEITNFIENELSGIDKAWTVSDRTCWSQNGLELATKISIHLEALLMEEFRQAYNYLKSFTVQSLRKPDRTFKLYSAFGKHKPSSALHSLLFDIIEQLELSYKRQAVDPHGMEVEPDFDVDKAITVNVAKMLRCHFADVFPRKYKLLPWICHQLLLEQNFEDKVVDALSQETVTYLHQEMTNVKIYKERGEMRKLTSTTYIMVFAKIRWDLSKLIDDTDREMIIAEMNVIEMEKMTIEIAGYMRHTIVSDALKHLPPKKTPLKVPKEMRKEISLLKGVKSTATVFNELEIHLYLENELEMMDVDSNTQGSSGLQVEDALNCPKVVQVRKEIDEIIKKHSFNEPYSLKIIQNLPRAFAKIQHEHGTQIHCQSPSDPNKFRAGTLGAFMVESDNNDNMFAVTCAHVVSTPNPLNVYIKETGIDSDMIVLGTVLPDWTINSGDNETFALIDFAAIKVDDGIKMRCVPNLKDEDGMMRASVVENENPDDLVGQTVFKYGARTDFTSGLIASVDLDIANSGQYLVMVEPLPGSANKFSDSGDSGSIICRTTPEYLSVVSMLNAGDFNCTGEEKKYTLSFMIKTALDLFVQKTSKVLIIQ